MLGCADGMSTQDRSDAVHSGGKGTIAEMPSPWDTTVSVL